MRFRSTWFWFTLALGLFAFIFLYERHLRPRPAGPRRVLPSLKAAQVTAVQIRPAGQLEIRAVRTNGGWQLVAPRFCPAQAASIESLLEALEHLTCPPAAYLTTAEIRANPKADEDYGFATPQAYLILEQGDFLHMQFGRKTAPGDQVFFQQVGGLEGAYVVDADVLKFLPRSVNDWRDTTFIDLRSLAFDRLVVTNRAKTIELQREGLAGPWRLIRPLPARVDPERVEELLQKLGALRVQRFVSDDPRTDLEPFGLQAPDLELTLAQGTNVLAGLQFGLSPTNDARQVYARRRNQGGIVTVPAELLAPWRVSYNDLRDRRLLVLNAPVEAVEVRGEDNFSLQRQTNGQWRVSPADFPADAALAQELVAALSRLRVDQFRQDVVTPPDLPDYGLATPLRQYLLQGPATNSPAGPTNGLLADLSFGFTTNLTDVIFVKRADESSIYTIKRTDFQELPASSWQFRERRLWHVSTNDIARVTVRNKGKERQMIRNGPFSWAFAPGSQGVLNDLAVEETVRGLVGVSALAWVARGEQNLLRCGFGAQSPEATLELKSGKKLSIDFGGESPTRIPYAAVKLDGEVWIMEFPPALLNQIASFLAPL